MTDGWQQPAAVFVVQLTPRLSPLLPRHRQTVHMVLDALAFKNEVQFWHRRKTMEGSIARSWLGVVGSRGECVAWIG